MLLAHEGGWDESLLVIVPLVLLAGLLQVARRRAVRERAAEEPSSVTEPPTE